MQNSSGTALNLFLNNDTEKKQLHLLSTEGDFVYHKDKKEGKKKVFIPPTKHQNWLENYTSECSCSIVQIQRQFSLIRLYPSLWEVTWSFKRCQFVSFSGDCKKPMWHLPTALHFLTSEIFQIIVLELPTEISTHSSDLTSTATSSVNCGV